MRSLVALCTLICLAQADIWPHLRTEWAPIPGLSGFKPKPRTKAELEADGWVQLSSCDDDNFKYGKVFKIQMSLSKVQKRQRSCTKYKRLMSAPFLPFSSCFTAEFKTNPRRCRNQRNDNCSSG